MFFHIFCSAPKNIVVTFPILKALTKEMTKGSDHFNVDSIIDETDNPHVFITTPKDYTRLQQADVLIENGLGLEPWLEPMIKNARFKKRRVVTSTGIIPMRFINNPNALDPHAWHNLKHAKIYIQNIADALIKEDPEHLMVYQKNRDAYLKKLDFLHKKIQTLFQKLNNKTIITTHDAFWYFGKEYGITFLSPLGISTNEEPSSYTMAKLIRYIKAHKIKSAVFEQHTNNTLVQKLIQETGIKQGGVLYADSLKNGDFIETIEHNAQTIFNALFD